MIELTQSLRRVCSHLDDVRGIALVGMDGLVVEEIKQDPMVELQTLAAEMSMSIKYLMEAAQSGSLGKLEYLQFGTAAGIVIVTGVGTDYFFLLVLKNGGNGGRGRFYLQLEADQLAGEI